MCKKYIYKSVFPIKVKCPFNNNNFFYIKKKKKKNTYLDWLCYIYTRLGKKKK